MTDKLLLALNLANLILWLAVIRGIRRRRHLLRDAGSVLRNMPETHDPSWERTATKVMQRIDREVGIP